MSKSKDLEKVTKVVGQLVDVIKIAYPIGSQAYTSIAALIALSESVANGNIPTDEEMDAVISKNKSDSDALADSVEASKKRNG